MNTQVRHMKKPIQHIEKQAYNPLPYRKSLRIATTPHHSMVEETCSSMEGSRSECDMSSNSSTNPSSESKRPSDKVCIQTKASNVQVALSTTKKMPKLIESKWTLIKSLKQVGSPQKPCHCVS